VTFFLEYYGDWCFSSDWLSTFPFTTYVAKLRLIHFFAPPLPESNFLFHLSAGRFFFYLFVLHNFLISSSYVTSSIEVMFLTFLKHSPPSLD